MGNYIARAIIDNYYSEPNKNKKKSKYLTTFKTDNPDTKHFDYKTGQLYPTKTNKKLQFNLSNKEKND
jgi:hypothetical protein